MNKIFLINNCNAFIHKHSQLGKKVFTNILLSERIMLLFFLTACLLYLSISANAQSGNSSNDAIIATTDTNYTTYNGTDQWFRYEATRSGKIIVQSCGLTTKNTVVFIYKKVNNILINIDNNDDACGEQSKISFTSDSGETYFIKWRIRYSTGTFPWLLKEEDLQPGDNCQFALDASIGDNNADNSNGDQWFKYTATALKKITISTCGYTSERTYAVIKKGDCDNLKDVPYNAYSCGSQTIFTFTVKAGETYYIIWKNSYTSASYTWTMTEEDYKPGEICETAIPAVVGTNNADNSEFDQWFSYTATHTGKTVISSCGLTSENTSLDLYQGNCDFLIPKNFNDNFCDTQSEIRFQADSGTTYYILWRDDYTTASYSWKISEEEWGPGEQCNTAIEAHLDTNEVTFDNYLYKYFKFQAPRSSIVNISNCGLTSASTSVDVTVNDCNNSIDTESKSCLWQTDICFPADSGAIYYIYWSSDIPTTFKWTITLDNIPAGNYCSSAYEAKAGLNLATNAFGQTWFRYTPAKNCKTTVSSCGLTGDDTYIQLQKGKCTDLTYIDENDNFCDSQSSLSFDADSGITYYISWLNYSHDTFSWKLTEEPLLPGDFCSVAINANIGTNTADNSRGDQWFVFTPTKKAKMIASTCDLTTENTNVWLYYGNCDEYYNITSSDNFCDTQSKISFNVDSGITYYIVWRDLYTSGSYSWILIEDSVMPGNITNIEGPANLCIGQRNVTYSVTPSTNATSYFWKLPDGTDTTTSVPSITISEITSSLPSGNISVYAKNQFGSTDTVKKNIVVSNVPDKPLITQNGSVLQSSAANGNQWYNLSGSIAGATNNSLTVGKSGKYFVIVTQNGCSSEPSDTIEVIINNITDNNYQPLTIKVYPNPVDRILNIELSDRNGIVHYEVFTITGTIIENGIIKGSATIGTQRWFTGTYLIRLTSNNKSEYIKLLKK